MTPGEVVLEHTAAGLSYTITFADIHLEFHTDIIEVIAELHYQLATNGNCGKKSLTLIGDPIATLNSIRINDQGVYGKRSTSGSVITIKELPTAGVIRLKTTVQMSDVHKLPGIHDCNGTLIFSYFNHTLGHLTFFPRNFNPTAASIKVSAIAVMDQALDTEAVPTLYPVLIAGNRSSVACYQQHPSMKTVELQDIQKSDIILMLSHVPYSVTKAHQITKTGKLATISLFGKPEHLDAGEFILTLVRACYTWYEKIFKAVPTFDFNIVAIPYDIGKDIITTNNVLICADFRCLVTSKTTTDTMVLNAAEFAARAFFTNVCDFENNPHLEPDKLTRDFLIEHFQLGIPSKYVNAEYTPSPLLVFLRLIATNDTRTMQLCISSEFAVITKYFAEILADNDISDNAKVTLLTMPNLHEITDSLETVDIDMLQNFYYTTAQHIGLTLKDVWLTIYYAKHSVQNELTPEAISRRKLMNLCLWYLQASGDDAYIQLSYEQIVLSPNINDQYSAFLATAYFHDLDPADLDDDISEAILRTSNDAPYVIHISSLLMATLHNERVYDILNETLEDLTPYQQFLLLRHFVKYNWQSFHDANYDGYTLLMHNILLIDATSPDLACDLFNNFEIILKLDFARRQAMYDYLRTSDGPHLSPGLLEKMTRLSEELYATLLPNSRRISPRHVHKKAAFPAFSMNESATWPVLFKQIELRYQEAEDRRITTIQRYDALAPIYTPTKKPKLS